MNEPNQTTTNESAPVSTAQQPRVTDEAMREGLKRLNVEHLVTWLEKYGYVAKPETPKTELIEAVLKLHESQIKDSEETVKKAVAETVNSDEELVRMRFMSLESPNASYEFAYPGPNGFQKGSNGRIKPASVWRFMHNRVYEVPRWMVKHLNSLMVPADRVVETDTQGFIQSLYSGDTSRQPRFSCTMELTPEQERRLDRKG